MEFWRNRNVFVTGATGLLGSWLTEELVARGAVVTCLVRDWVPRSRLVRERIIERVNVVRGDLEDYQVLVRALNEYEIDTVFHLGAQTIVGTASRSALSTFEANVRGTWNLLEAARTCSRLIRRVLVASSDKAYGAQEKLPYTEETALAGRFPYDVSKSCADMIALSYFHTYQVPVAITRCGNLFGGGDLNFNRLIPGTIRSALDGERPIIRSDGTFVRDYFYVRDAVGAYLSLAERIPEPSLTGQAFNFGNETPISVLELVREILRVMGREGLEPVVLNQATHEIPRQYLDCAKARRLLDWRPCHSLADGLRETIAWYERHECPARVCSVTPEEPAGSSRY
jgi:CDP-glucose 4,6-dehydratase